MHSDLIEKILARRLRALADEPTEAPYDWAEFERRRRSAPTRKAGRSRLALAAAVVAVAVIAGVGIVRLHRQHVPAVAQANGRGNGLDRAGSATPITATDRLTPARTRAIEGWLAELPHDPAVVRVGTHVAVTSLQDQIAELDDLMSAERVAGAQPARLDSLEQQRAQLISSLAQLRYAEMLASATP